MSIHALASMGIQADVWAMGVSFYALVFGELPFKADGLVRMIDVLKIIR
jgi:serine/threonine protein kinase